LSNSLCALIGLSNQNTASLKSQPQKWAQNTLLGYANLHTTPAMIPGLFFLLFSNRNDVLTDL